ncbi:Flp family type IVb pilin [Loktanella sp. DJP18]|uniref:Flp family type IVb pilin n=1 Tax=Loktanella sp. DJP18 TaxID=3409788 RepID=UPI003BB4EE8A
MLTLKTTRSTSVRRPGITQNDHGASIVEYGLLAGLVATVSLVGITPVGQQISLLMRRAEVATHITQHEAYSSDGCFIGTDAAEAVSYRAGVTCYHLGNGPDYFFGAASSESLVLSGGTGSGALIETGSGDDTIKLSQSGVYATGPGADTLILSLTSASPGPIEVDLGDGDDTINLTSIQLPDRLSRHRIRSGPGSNAFDLDCGNDFVEIEIAASSRNDFTGNCAVEFSQASGAPVGMTHMTGTNLKGMSGTLTGSVLLDASLTHDAPSQSLAIRDAGLLNIDYAVHIQTAASFKIIGSTGGAHPASQVSIDISAATGSFILDGAGQQSWSINIAYGPNGAAGFDFPDEDGFAAMSFPNMTGVVDIIRVGGCSTKSTSSTPQCP